MSNRPKRPCRKCRRALVEGGGFCPICLPAVTKRYDRERPERHALYATTRWRKLRLTIIARDPLCRDCNKAISTHVDHVNGFESVADPMAYEPSNLQGLCESCHNRKTAKEKGWGK